MELSLGFSPCPNDCFIFHALLHGKLDTQGITFKPVIEDVEALNKRAERGELDISKLSIPALIRNSKNYILLDSGAALGFGVGPLLIAKNADQEISERTLIAIPGQNTTANQLLTMAFPHATNKREMLFSQIEAAVVKGEVDAGLIIHESRFTFEEKGLKKIMDLGEWWEKKTGMPIPLGCIAMKKNIDAALIDKVEKLIAQSIEYAFDHPKISEDFIKKHSAEMDDEVIKKHIALYVNKHSISLGSSGRQAIEEFTALA